MIRTKLEINQNHLPRLLSVITHSKSGSIYLTELKTLMYDSCNNVPVLVLRWSRECAEYLANILRSPDCIGNGYYDAGRIYAMGINEIKNKIQSITVEKIIGIPKRRKRKSI